ncbi:hypothetical protein IJ135_01755 [Candidatus Saccharibacteria bacterium]|nr:hypothetical protein [Candidatus Saccharibacteria bacterium]
MGKVNILITCANGNLREQTNIIHSAARAAEDYAFSRLKINWDIDLLVTNRIYDIIIPEDGVGGRTRASDFIEFAIDEEKATENLISEMVAHELCHAARWGKNDEWVDTLFDNIICEGIATCFEAEFADARNEKTVFIQTILQRSENINETIFKNLFNQLDSNYYDYNTIFFSGDNTLPRWSGYSLGYYLVKKYLKRTGKKIEDAFSDRYADFRAVLQVKSTG